MYCEPGIISGTKGTMVNKTYGMGLNVDCILMEKKDKKHANPDKVAEEKTPLWAKVV